MGVSNGESHMGVSKDESDNAHTFNSDDTLFKSLLSLCGMGMATSQRFVLTNRLLNKKVAPTLATALKELISS
jgi:hypothetical protein